VHVPALFHAEEVQIQVDAGFLKAASMPLHMVQTIALAHYVQLLLHAEF
jgi:hypothetical protein